MLCSTIIPTIGRDCLHFAVESALQQQISVDDYEVVIANDSGRALPPATWMESPQVKIVDTHRSERSVARNTGAAIASGRYLNFLDDDDVLCPDAIPVLLDVAQAVQVSRVVGAYRCINHLGEEVAFVSPSVTVNYYLTLLLAGESLPWGASIISRDVFVMVGGFDAGLRVREDYDLECRHAIAGNVAVTPHVVAEFRVGGAGSTDWSQLRDVTHYVRSKILPNCATLKRIWPDITLDSDLAARVFYSYLGTAAWCFGKGRMRDGIAILRYGVQIAGHYRASGGFWRAAMLRRVLVARSLLI